MIKSSDDDVIEQSGAGKMSDIEEEDTDREEVENV